MNTFSNEPTDTTVSNVYFNNFLISANLIELGSKIITNIAGNDISTKVDNQDIKKALKSLFAAKINQRLAHYKQGI